MTTNIDRAAEVIYQARIDAPPTLATEDFIARRLADAGLLAAECKCPALDNAHAAVAEVIRLRKAIAEFAAEERATADDEFYPDHLRSLFRAYADDLTRVLEGDTDE
jgi:hypothetical protein